MKAVVLNPLILAVLVVMVLYVRVAWWGTPRFGEHFPWIAALGATVIVAAVAALTRGSASADELLFTRPSNAWLEAAALTALVTLPVFGASARSVGLRQQRNPSGPTAWDWIASVLAGIVGLLFIVTLVIVLGVLAWR